jgi:tight adherence protein C
MADWTPIAVAALAFCAMAGIVFVLGQYYARAAQLNRRLPVAQAGTGPTHTYEEGAIAGFVARHFDEKRFGVDEATRGRLRASLVQAGYFRKDAINFYVFWRLAAVIILPLLLYFLLRVFAPNTAVGVIILAAAIGAVLGIVGPDAFISRKQRLLAGEYRKVFPDFMDLLVVCVDAGLSLEGALDRTTDEVTKRNRHFGINLAIMEAEMRAGRAFIDALSSLADRLMIPEARSLVALLRQSQELGSDVGDALRVFSDEMRDKRLLRAEEQANKLTVKMVVPLALFIFPVILLVVMLPIVVRLLTLFRL